MCLYAQQLNEHLNQNVLTRRCRQVQIWHILELSLVPVAAPLPLVSLSPPLLFPCTA